MHQPASEIINREPDSICVFDKAYERCLFWMLRFAYDGLVSALWASDVDPRISTSALAMRLLTRGKDRVHVSTRYEDGRTGLLACITPSHGTAVGFWGGLGVSSGNESYMKYLCEK